MFIALYFGSRLYYYALGGIDGRPIKPHKMVSCKFTMTAKVDFQDYDCDLRSLSQDFITDVNDEERDFEGDIKKETEDGLWEKIKSVGPLDGMHLPYSSIHDDNVLLNSGLMNTSYHIGKPESGLYDPAQSLQTLFNKATTIPKPQPDI